MTLAVARMRNGRTRLFAGRFHTRASTIGCFKPFVTGSLDRAKEYDDQVVAQAIADYLNVLDTIHTGRRSLPWIVLTLPEAWTS